MAALRQLTEGYSSNNLRDGPNRGAGVGGDAQLLSISYPTTTIWDGLPAELEEEVDEVMDNRLAESSRAKVMTSPRDRRPQQACCHPSSTPNAARD